MIVKNVELSGALRMVLARLESEPRSVEEWRTIEEALGEAYAYAVKCRKMREKRIIVRRNLAPMRPENRTFGARGVEVTMSTSAHVVTDGTAKIEIATVAHEGREFTSLGSVVDTEHDAGPIAIS